MHLVSLRWQFLKNVFPNHYMRMTTVFLLKNDLWKNSTSTVCNLIRKMYFCETTITFSICNINVFTYFYLVTWYAKSYTSFFLAAWLSMWDHSSLTRDWICVPLNLKCRILTTGLLGKSLNSVLSGWDLIFYHNIKKYEYF